MEFTKVYEEGRIEIRGGMLGAYSEFLLAVKGHTVLEKIEPTVPDGPSEKILFAIKECFEKSKQEATIYCMRKFKENVGIDKDRVIGITYKKGEIILYPHFETLDEALKRELPFQNCWDEKKGKFYIEVEKAEKEHEKKTVKMVKTDLNGDDFSNDGVFDGNTYIVRGETNFNWIIVDSFGQLSEIAKEFCVEL